MFLGTVLLEANRWKDRDHPLARFDEKLLAAARDAGFDGLELWENHFHLARHRAAASLRSSPCPVRILNWYGVPGVVADEDRLLRACEAFSATLQGVKFNLSGNPSAQAGEEGAVERLAARMPPDVSLLCECHAGTTLESPAIASRTFSRWPDTVGAILHPFDDMAEIWLDALGSRVRHLHLQLRCGGTWADPAPGDDQVDAGCRRLRCRGFQGTATLEFIAAISSLSRAADLLSAAAAVRARWTAEPWLADPPCAPEAREH